MVCWKFLTKFFLAFLVLGFAIWAGSLSESRSFSRIDRILVEKNKRVMSVFYKGKFLKSYKIALGGNPVGHKVQEGDQKTPEGTYHISAKYPKSQFYLALQISYPNTRDSENARKKGVSPGGQIMIHGLGKTFGWLGKLHVKSDWTLGCVAVTNEQIKEIYDACPVGTKVDVRS